MSWLHRVFKIILDKNYIIWMGLRLARLVGLSLFFLWGRILDILVTVGKIFDLIVVLINLSNNGLIVLIIIWIILELIPSIEEELDFFISDNIFESCDIFISLNVNYLVGVFMTLLKRSIGLMLQFSILLDRFVTLLRKRVNCIRCFFGTLIKNTIIIDSIKCWVFFTNNLFLCNFP